MILRHPDPWPDPDYPPVRPWPEGVMSNVQMLDYINGKEPKREPPRFMPSQLMLFEVE